jgi:fatty acyl-ACP thioesterase B
MAEISPWFIEKQAIQEDVPEKISKLDSKAKYVNSNLKVNFTKPNIERKCYN